MVPIALMRMRTSDTLPQRERPTFREYLNQRNSVSNVEQNPAKSIQENPLLPPPPHQAKQIPFKLRKLLNLMVHFFIRACVLKQYEPL